MDRRHVDVPAVVRARAEAAAGGRAWLDGLGERLTAVEREWSLTTTDALPGGTASLVVRARTRDGEPAVLKLAVPGTGFADQVRTLTAARGDGYVRVLAHDPRREAVLLEALGPTLQDAGLTPTAQLGVLARCLRRAWRTPPSAEQRPLDKAAELGDLVDGLWRRLGGPCSVPVREQAVACARRRSAAFAALRDNGSCVVVHGDAAAVNAARVLTPRPGTEDGFVLLDPDGFLGDPAHDLGVALRDWCPELLASAAPTDLLARRCRVLAEPTSVDPVAIWEFGFLERVSTGLFALSLGATEHAAPLLRTAEALLADGWARGGELHTIRPRHGRRGP